MIKCINKKFSLVCLITIFLLLVLVPSVFADENSTVTISLPEANGHPVRTSETGEPSRYVMTSIVICKRGYRF